VALARRLAEAMGLRPSDSSAPTATASRPGPTSGSADSRSPSASAPAAASAAPASAARPAIEWQIATVKAITPETSRAKTFTLELPNWRVHRAGQHYDVRLTAADGYQAERSYSIASEPERTGEIDLTVELIPDGEVSAYMHGVLVAGDKLEVRGPIGGYFVWEADDPEPLGLVAGGSGVVPLMAMLRHRAAAAGRQPARLLYSSRTADDVIYAAELARLAAAGDGAEVFQTLTRGAPDGWTGYMRRIDEAMLQEVLGPLGRDVRVFVCGPTLLVESVADALVAVGLPADRIKTERFGPTGS
jgi:ferredoxin-NADP reductase